MTLQISQTKSKKHNLWHNGSAGHGLLGVYGGRPGPR